MRVSQEKFADDIKMHRAYYGGIERGEKNLQIVTLKKVCKGLGAPIWQVLRDAENS
jgi:transcriptional regulator with XRE-family HTH domain